MKYFRRFLFLFLALTPILAAVACKEKEKDENKSYQSLIVSEPVNVVMTSGNHVLALVPDGDDGYRPETYLKDGSDYVPMFASRQPFYPGLGNPTGYTVSEKDGIPYCEMTGTSSRGSFRIICRADAEGVFTFEIREKISSRAVLSGLYVGAGMEGTAEVHYGQMPESIYGAGNYGVGMPAAYLWDRGREAVILFDCTDMVWMNKAGFLPGKNAVADVSEASGRTTLGLISGTPCTAIFEPGDEIFVKFHLYAGFSEKRSGLDCILQKTSVMASFHPTEAKKPALRSDLKKNYTLNWKSIADKTADGLLNSLSFYEVTMKLDDPILAEARGNTVYMSNARPGAAAYAQTDFSCNNNFLSSLAAYNRIAGRTDVSPVVSAKMDALQFYYDPACNKIRWGFRSLNVSDTSMPWQSFFYDVETYRADLLCSDSDFSPAALAGFLNSMDGITEAMEKNGYVLSQFFNFRTKELMTQQDVPALGTVYEPWQVGTYAYSLCKAYEITGDKRYLTLAGTAVKKVAEEVSFSVRNSVYSKDYTDSAAFPITELFGTANGTYACYRLYQLTGEEIFKNYSENFFAMLMQMTFWYDDQFTEAAGNSSLLGLFEPHGGAGHSCPWETIEAYIPLCELLDETGDYRFNDLILRLFNCERSAAYSYYPITWPESFKRQIAYRKNAFFGIPTEPLYNSMNDGNSDQGALYMSSISFWNALMFETFGHCDNEEIMALCTDIHDSFESALRSGERSFVLYNPKDREMSFRFLSDALADGTYTVTAGGKEITYSAGELREGIPFTLPAKSSIRILIRNHDPKIDETARQDIEARYLFSYAYYSVRDAVQKQAETVFRTCFPKASDEEITRLGHYVLTYMSYEDAVSLARTAEGPEKLEQLFAVRTESDAKSADDRLPQQFVKPLSELEEIRKLFVSGAYAEVCSRSRTLLES